MKPRTLAVTALGVIVSALIGIAAVLSTPDQPASSPDPAQTNFDQPSIGEDPPAYKPLFRPLRKPCDGPDCPQ